MQKWLKRERVRVSGKRAISKDNNNTRVVVMEVRERETRIRVKTGGVCKRWKYEGMPE